MQNNEEPKHPKGGDQEQENLKCPSDSTNTVVFINKDERIPAILVKTSQFTSVRFAMAGGRVIKYAFF